MKTIKSVISTIRIWYTQRTFIKTIGIGQRFIVPGIVIFLCKVTDNCRKVNLILIFHVNFKDHDNPPVH